MDSADRPLTAAEFQWLMAALGPFERRPHVAVALSGGPDSMALALLMQGWVQGQGGSLLTLTVDHGLRPGSGVEAAAVAAWMRARGIPNRILAWTAPKPATGIHEAARAARYALLEQACRDLGILHLALGHQREDQAETIAIRQEMRSGPDGLAGMPAIRERPGLRLIRPLLGIARARLAATCAAAGQPFATDPSNLDARFARGRLRAGLQEPATEDMVLQGRQAALARAEGEDAVAASLARHGAFHPEGWAELSRSALDDPDPENGLRLLGRLLRAVGGRTYQPRRERMLRLLDRLRTGPDGFAGASLGGCLVTRRGDLLRIVREPASVDPPVIVAPGGSALWDGRFRLEWDGPGSISFGALGEHGCAELASDAVIQRQGGTWQRTWQRLPASVRRTLPSLWRDGTVLIVPHLSYARSDSDAVRYRLWPQASAPAAEARFPVVLPAGDII